MKGDRLFRFFLTGCLVVASLLVFLYRGIENDSQAYAFLLLSTVVLFCFCVYLMELMYLSKVIDRIIDFAHDSKLVMNIMWMSLFLLFLVVIPIKIIQFVREDPSIETNQSDFDICTRVADEILKSPAQIYNITLLAKCQYTKPLTMIIPSEKSEVEKKAKNLLTVINEYVDLFSNQISLLVTAIVAIVGGVSYAALATIFVKKLLILVFSLFNASAIKILASPYENDQ